MQTSITAKTQYPKASPQSQPGIFNRRSWSPEDPYSDIYPIVEGLRIRTDHIADLLEIIERLADGGAFLDLGAGSGDVARLLHQRGLPGFALDIHPKIVEIDGSPQAQQEAPKLRCVQGNMTDLGCLGHIFNLAEQEGSPISIVYAINSFYATTTGEPNKRLARARQAVMINAITQLLPTGGHFVISEPLGTALFDLNTRDKVKDLWRERHTLRNHGLKALRILRQNKEILAASHLFPIPESLISFIIQSSGYSNNGSPHYHLETVALHPSQYAGHNVVAIFVKTEN